MCDVRGQDTDEVWWPTDLISGYWVLWTTAAPHRTAGAVPRAEGRGPVPVQHQYAVR
jgi:hypothetical protein